MLFLWFYAVNICLVWHTYLQSITLHAFFHFHSSTWNHFLLPKKLTIVLFCSRQAGSELSIFNLSKSIFIFSSLKHNLYQSVIHIQERAHIISIQLSGFLQTEFSSRDWPWACPAFQEPPCSFPVTAPLKRAHPPDSDIMDYTGLLLNFVCMESYVRCSFDINFFYSVIFVRLTPIVAFSHEEWMPTSVAFCCVDIPIFIYTFYYL